jgi:hypothetical protein
MTGFTKRPTRSAATTAALLIAIFIFTMMPYLLRRFFYSFTLSDIAFCMAFTALWGLLVYAIYSKLRKQELRDEHIREKIEEELLLKSIRDDGKKMR